MTTATQETDLRTEPWISGVGMTEFTDESDDSLDGLLERAALDALDDAGIELGRLDAIYLGNMAAEAFSRQSGLANALAGGLGAYGSNAKRIENTSASGGSAFESAITAIRDGTVERALVVGGEKMSAATTAQSTDIISRIVHRQEYEQGITLPAFAGLAADTYLDRYDVDRKHLARIPVKNHRNALSNPYAQFRKRITVDDVLTSPSIADPLRLYDCCPTGDGAAAVAVESSNSADQASSVRVRNVGSAAGTHAVAERSDVLTIPSVSGAAANAFAGTELTTGSVEVACLHDAFSILEWLEMEALGFYEQGHAWMGTLDGAHEVDGA